MSDDFKFHHGMRCTGRSPEPYVPVPGGCMRPTKPVVTVNGTGPDRHGNVTVRFPEFEEHVADRNDPHGTRDLVPIIYVGASLPPPTRKYKDTDVFILRGKGEMYRMESRAWRLLDVSGSVKPLAGRSVRLDTENDLYDAVQTLLENLGATIV